MSKKRLRAEEPVRFELTLSRGFVWDLFVTAMESGYSRWVREARLRHIDPDDLVLLERSKKAKPRLVWWGHDCLKDCTSQRVHLSYFDEDDREKECTLAHADLAKALTVLGRESPRSLALFLEDDADGPSADAWLQCAVFGKVVYD